MDVKSLIGPQAFAAQVVGDQMEPAYHEGDFVIFAPNATVHNGDDCLIRFDDDSGTTFKRFYQDSVEQIRFLGEPIEGLHYFVLRRLAITPQPEPALPQAEPTTFNRFQASHSRKNHRSGISDSNKGDTMSLVRSKSPRLKPLTGSSGMLY